MNLQKIELLIRKYEQGESSVQEEKELKAFFQSDHVPFHLAGYKDLFAYYSKAGQEELTDPDFDEKLFQAIKSGKAPDQRSRYRRLYPVIGIAASIGLLVGIYFVGANRNQQTDTFNDPQIAYLETKKALMMVSDNLNAGVGELGNMEEMSNGLDNLNSIKTFDEGMKKMRKISVLDKSKDIITQKTNTQ